MTEQVTEVESVSDALFSCVYRWAHGKPYTRTDVENALHQHKDPATAYGKLVLKLEQLQAMSYDELCDAGFLDTDSEKAISLRREALEEFIPREELLTLLADTESILRIFPESGGNQSRKKTRLPLSRGSDGFDARQDYVMKHILPAQSLCSIYGPSGSYKSFLAVSWACHVAAGRPWAGKKVTPGAVMYVVGEGGVGVPRRVRAWEQVHGMVANNLYLVNRPVFPVRPAEINEVLVAARQVESECGFPVRLVVIDTLARCFGGNDENDARDMGAFIEGCDTIKQKTGATVLVVHHSGKDEAKGARGSSSFRAALDAEFNVKREGDGRALILSCTKMKDAEEMEKKAYDLRPVDLYTDEDGENICSLVVRDVPRDAKEIATELATVTNITENHATLWNIIRSRVADGGPCTKALVRDDMKAMGVSNVKNFGRWLTKLERDGVIAISGENLSIISKRKSDDESE